VEILNQDRLQNFTTNKFTEIAGKYHIIFWLTTPASCKARFLEDFARTDIVDQQKIVPVLPKEYIQIKLPKQLRFITLLREDKDFHKSCELTFNWFKPRPKLPTIPEPFQCSSSEASSGYYSGTSSLPSNSPPSSQSGTINKVLYESQKLSQVGKN